MMPQITYQEFEEIRKTNQLIIIYAGASWCDSCTMYKPVIQNLYEEKINNTLVYYLDVDKEEDIVNICNITGIPTTLFIKDSKIIRKESGYRSIKLLHNIIEEINQ